MTKRALNDRRALITGASSGIGRALAFELAGGGANLVLVARREERLAEIVEQIRTQFARKAIAVAGDVTIATVRQRAVQTATHELGGLDILINNAGIAAHGRFADADPARVRPLFETNFFAPLELIRTALPELRKGREPMIVNIGSILGERGCPHKSEYSASKFALHGFSEALRAELSKEGIDVLVVAAGPTETGHFDVLLEDKGKLPWREPRRANPEKVARQITHAIERGQHQLVTGWGSWWWLLLNRLSPRLVDAIMARYG